MDIKSTNNKSTHKEKPFVKWAGGKRQFIEKINHLIPEYDRYIEPFVGGGAMLFALKPKNFIINDINEELIISYQVLKKRREEELLKKIDSHSKKHSEKYYIDVRKIDYKKLDCEIEKAARFIYLNKGGFNGLYRLNLKGEFNVPWNKNLKTNFYQIESIKKTAKFLEESDCEIYNDDYKKILKKAKRGDFLFVDPPYDNLNTEKSKTFNSYTKNGFSSKDQEELANILNKLTKIGVKWILCNYNTPLIQKLYKNNQKLQIPAIRSISSDASKRKGKFEEVFYYNYEKR